MNEIYFDNNATTPLDPRVREAMEPYLHEEYGNPSSQHEKGIRAQRAITDARHSIARLLCVNASEIIFTSGATEGINMMIKGAARGRKKKGMHIVTSLIEHECVLEACRDLEEEGWRVTYLTPDSFGRITSERVVQALTDETTCVALMHVNNELGTITDVEGVGQALKTHDPSLVFIVDGVQAYGKLSVDLSSIDSYVISGHKVHGPKGGGAVYLKEGVRVLPLISGGGQERGLRSGTENVPAIVGLGKASDSASEHHNLDGITEIKNIFCDVLSSVNSIHSNSPDDALPTTLNISFPGISSQHLLHLLEEDGIYISTGSACSSHAKRKSHVLAGINAPPEIQESAVRISISRMNTPKEARIAAQSIHDKVLRLLSQ